MNFKEERNQRQVHIEAVLAAFLPEAEGYHKRLIEAMNYSILAGGKRLRPMLLEETCLMFQGNDADPRILKLCYPFMAALEMIHTYSLVHDDLPAMDDDEYRRGRKTTHVVYGEAFAILAGDGLLNLAFETAALAFDVITGPEGYDEALWGRMLRRVAEAMQILGRRAGICGMIGGQAADILAEQDSSGLNKEILLYIHENKTAALIQAAMTIGGVLAGAGPEEVARLEKAARNIGIAFQIQDDILDITGSFEALGKPIGSDDKNHKLTYVSVNGLDQARKDVEDMSREAIDILKSFNGEACNKETCNKEACNKEAYNKEACNKENEFLIRLVEELIHRTK